MFDLLSEKLQATLSDVRSRGTLTEDDINKAMREPDVRARLEQVGTQLRETRPEEFEEFMKAEIAKYAKLVKDANVRLD